MGGRVEANIEWKERQKESDTHTHTHTQTETNIDRETKKDRH
jgi:hypothetical protein